jgi:hypothetical protein
LNKQERIVQLWLSGETMGSIALQVELTILEVATILRTHCMKTLEGGEE